MSKPTAGLVSKGMKFLKRKVSYAYNPQNKVRFIHGGREYFETLERMLDDAKRVIHFQTYIFSDDRTGIRIKNALVRASERGVRVFLLCDGYATGFPDAWLQEFMRTGIYFRYFEPLFSGKNFYFGRRLHHKVVVCDERYALVGGINVSDRYHGTGEEPPWLDYAVWTEGQAAATLHVICGNLWGRRKNNPVLPNLVRKFIFSEASNPNPALVRVRRNDWVRGQINVLKSYVEMLHHAQKDIIIVSSYFFPNRLFRIRMARAAKRGVRLRVVLAGVSDVRISRHAARYLYGWLLQNGIEVYEYTRTVLHAKIATCDRTWMTVGSYNINNLSSSASIELNLDIREKAFVESVDADLESMIRSHCRQITIKDYNLRRNLFTRFVEWSAYTISRFLLFLFTYNLKQEQRA
jgi:cardiolipin synthase